MMPHLAGDASSGSVVPRELQTQGRGLELRVPAALAPAVLPSVPGGSACLSFGFFNMSKQTASLPALSDVVALFSPKLPKHKVST